MATSLVGYNPPLDLTRGEEVKRLLTGSLGNPASGTRWGYFFYDFTQGTVPVSRGGIGAGTYSYQRGYTRLESTAAAGTGYELYFGDAAGVVTLPVQSGATGKWAVYAKMKFDNALSGADSRLGISLRNSAGAAFVRVGYSGAVSTSNWTVHGDTASIDSGVATDTSVHEFLVYRDGTTTYLFIDGVARGSGANVYPAANVGLHCIAYNGSVASAMYTSLSSVAIMYPEAT